MCTAPALRRNWQRSGQTDVRNCMPQSCLFKPDCGTFWHHIYSRQNEIRVLPVQDMQRLLGRSWGLTTCNSSAVCRQVGQFRCCWTCRLCLIAITSLIWVRPGRPSIIPSTAAAVNAIATAAAATIQSNFMSWAYMHIEAVKTTSCCCHCITGFMCRSHRQPGSSSNNVVVVVRDRLLPRAHTTITAISRQ